MTMLMRPRLLKNFEHMQAPPSPVPSPRVARLQTSSGSHSPRLMASAEVAGASPRSRAASTPAKLGSRIGPRPPSVDTSVFTDPLRSVSAAALPMSSTEHQRPPIPSLNLTYTTDITEEVPAPVAGMEEEEEDDDPIERYEANKNPPATLSFKLILLGESGVGKTSVLSTLRRREPCMSTRPTVGVDFCTLFYKYAGEVISVQVWDTAGTERFAANMPQYFRGANACMLVLSITDNFEKVESYLTDSISQFQHYAGQDALILLVGNKADLVEKRQLDPPSMLRFCARYEMDYAETSALLDQGVTIAFESVVKELYKKHREKISQRQADPGRARADPCPTPRGKPMPIQDPGKVLLNPRDNPKLDKPAPTGCSC